LMYKVKDDINDDKTVTVGFWYVYQELMVKCGVYKPHAKNIKLEWLNVTCGKVCKSVWSNSFMKVKTKLGC
jgi:hypothetical protein